LEIWTHLAEQMGFPD